MICKRGANASGRRKANSDKRANPFPSLGESGIAVKYGLKASGMTPSGGGRSLGHFWVNRNNAHFIRVMTGPLSRLYEKEARWMKTLDNSWK
jgi:hypothetical protein